MCPVQNSPLKVPQVLSNITFLPTSKSSELSLPFRFSNQNTVCISYVPHTLPIISLLIWSHEDSFIYVSSYSWEADTAGHDEILCLVFLIKYGKYCRLEIIVWCSQDKQHSCTHTWQQQPALRAQLHCYTTYTKEQGGILAQKNENIQPHVPFI
jgi:hypothetical protein